MPFEAPLLGATDRPLYQRISAEVKHLRGLGLSLTRIAAHLRVTDKTVAKALADEPGPRVPPRAAPRQDVDLQVLVPVLTREKTRDHADLDGFSRPGAGSRMSPLPNPSWQRRPADPS